jgi:hypothetical protein
MGRTDCGSDGWTAAKNEKSAIPKLGCALSLVLSKVLDATFYGGCLNSLLSSLLNSQVWFCYGFVLPDIA